MDTCVLLSYVLLPILLMSTTWPTDAAGRCTIDDDNRIDLSDHSLTSVPSNLPTNTQYLDLSFNNITTLMSEDLSDFPALCVFKMANCGLKLISSEAFQGNPVLQELDLSFNALSAIPPIQGLAELRVLDLSDNLYQSLTLSPTFQTLHSLSSLSLGGPQVSRLDKFDLKPLTSSPLSELTLRTGTNLTHFSTDFLSYLSRIKTVTLQVNFCRTPKLFSDVLLDLQSSSVDALVIEKLLPKVCDVAANLTDSLRYLGKLQHLTLRDSWFSSSFLAQAFVHVIQSQLQTLSVQNVSYRQESSAGARLMSVPDESKIGTLRVVTINTFHYYEYSPLQFFLNLSLFEGLEKFACTGCAFRFPGNVMHRYEGDITTLQTLDISNNNIDVLALGNYVHLISNLKELIVRNNKLSNLYIAAQYLHLFTSLESVDLSFNPLRLTHHKKVPFPSHLRNLSLSGNPLGSGLFGHLSPYFVSLNLTLTDITSINTQDLSSMKDLKQLFLGSNSIRELPADLQLPVLEELHVDHNSINTFRPETFRGLPKLQKLNGGHNPFICDCDLYWFINDFNKTLLVDWPTAYKCNSPSHLSGTPLVNFHPGKVACSPRLIFAISFLVILFVLLSCSVAFYVLDGSWYARMLWTWLRVKQRSQNKDRRLEESTFSHHAFISYSERDAEWVQSELVPHLEASGFRLCIHERDFVPGEWIIDNIIKCVESSYKTVFVLSQSFVQSEWCNYELFFAQHRSILVHEDSLVLVLLEPIPPHSLSRKFLRLRLLLRQQTYLPWPRERPKRQLFWANLTALLRTGDQRVTADQETSLGDHGVEYTERDPLMN